MTLPVRPGAVIVQLVAGGQAHVSRAGQLQPVLSQHPHLCTRRRVTQARGTPVRPPAGQNDV